MSGVKKSGGRRPGSGRPRGAMNKDKARPYFASLKNAILKKNPEWVEEIEYTLSVMNDKDATQERRDLARDTLLNFTYTRPAPAETQAQEQLGFNLQWGNGETVFDPASISTADVATKGARLN